MRRAPQTPVISGTLYRTIAMLVIGLAMLVALFGGGNPVEAPAAEPTQHVADAVPDRSAGFAAPADMADMAEVTSQSDSPEEGAAMPLPEGDARPPGAARAPDPARPTPAQLAHLIEQSRLRSGANPGGD